MAIGLAAPAGAAPGDLTTTVTWVQPNTATPVDQLRGTLDSRQGLNSQVGLAVGYACGPAECIGTTIQIAPMPVDPYYGAYRFATLDGQSLPAGATIVGNAATGYTVNMGTIAAGASGSFQMLYRYQSRPVGPSPQSFFPEGFEVAATTTIAASGIEPTSATDSITWHIDTPEPAVAFLGTEPARAGVDYTYRLVMASGCLWERSTAGHGEPMVECAESYSATNTLPTGAQFVSATHGGTYDASSNMVTWSATGRDAATGWGAVTGSGSVVRNVTVQFPESMVPDPGQCVIQVTSALAVDAVYLSGATGTAATTTTHDLNACEPFGNGEVVKSSTRTMGTVAEPIVWTGTSGEYWDVRVANRSNVPAVATIVDDTLDLDGLDVYAVRLTAAGTITYTLDDGSTGTVTGTAFNAPAGRHIASATVVSSPIPGPNLMESDQSRVNYFYARFVYRTADEAPDGGYTGTNTASATLTFPGTPELSSLDLGSSGKTVTVIDRPATLSPRLGRVVTGGGNPVPGTPVTFTGSAITSNQDPGVDYQPQYVFVAPENWAITPGSATIAGITDATFTYRTVLIDGVERQSVVATRPPGTVWGVNTTWPTLTVVASPTASAIAGASARALFYMGDAMHNYGPTDAIWGATGGTTFGAYRYVDAADLDGDGMTTENFAYTYADTVNGATSALNVVKEICLPDAGAADGCDWISDSSTPVQVDPDATDITYRVTVANGGNSPLSNVVAYDVLPHQGDFGTSASTATVPRGSTLDEALAAAPDATGDVALTFSPSTNPCREEVYPGGPAGCDNTWGTAAPDAVSIRADAGTIDVGEVVSFTYTARIVSAATAGDLACNSVAVGSATTPVTEPAAVCALIAEADLAVTVDPLADWQQDRPRSVTVTATNLAGSPEAPARVAITIPAGVTLQSLPTTTDSTCTVPGVAPIEGPVDLDCVVTAGLSVDQTLTLNLDLVPTVETEICLTAAVTGTYADPELANNEASSCVTPASAYTVPGLTKTDGVGVVAAGETTTYTIAVSNPLVGETLTDVTVTDPLPAGATFVSATEGGSATDGVVTWTIASLPAAATVSLEVVVQAPADASAQMTNVVTATAPDPAFPGTTLTNSATDVDDLAAITLDKAVVFDGEPRAGEIVTFLFTISNSGTADLAEMAIDDPMPGLGQIAYGWAGDEGVLPAGSSVVATAEYELTQADVDAGTITNTATASGSGQDDVTVSVTDGADLALAALPALVVAKSAAGEPAAAAGDEVTFVIQVTNSGNVTLQDVDVADELEGLPALDYQWPGTAGELAPGEQVLATATYAVTQLDVENGGVRNVATSTATAVRGGDVAGEAEVTVPVVGTPALEVRKTHAGDVAAAGAEIDYLFEVENTGNLTLTGVGVTDHLAGVSTPVVTWPGEPGVLAPGEVATALAQYVVAQAEVDRGEVVNTVSATGQSVQGPASAAAQDVLTIPEQAAIEFTKTADVTRAAVGDTLAYTFVLTNTGNVTLTGASISDPLVGLTTIQYQWPAAVGVLTPGESVTATASYVVLADVAATGAVTNTAAAHAATVQGTDVVAEASVTVELDGPPADPGVDPAPGEPNDGAAGGGNEDLPSTGTQALAGVGAAGLLVALGVILLGVNRRREDTVSNAT
ncbi:DUF7507 domain-containing protein [Occultella gossypii]|uniref:DUF11 domain-containing protein n=1 Tax=Occultella gossypii TaxID=2800820 RepID=A0ABS7S8X9_9MICO|nr:LPXTG cell wall anchor domain-containing protein [Occultella gossypii]MBZ2196747.1 DUF11 domain-containing protein [Occultella gossypii]